MGILTEDERNVVETIVSPGSVICATIARLYTSANNGPWTYSKRMGAVALVRTEACGFM